jgi:hypothetical protein
MDDCGIDDTIRSKYTDYEFDITSIVALQLPDSATDEEFDSAFEVAEVMARDEFNRIISELQRASDIVEKAFA